MIKASIEMGLKGVEMPPDAFLVLEGSAVSSTAMAAPGLPIMMQAMMPGGMGIGEVFRIR